MWETTTYYNPPAGTWKTKTIEAHTPTELDSKIANFMKTLKESTFVQSVQYAGYTSKVYTAMVIYIQG